ncbi:MAG: hypothetical protein KKB21_01105 [Nanoarchaeota archaeon]|nr:hypothetical protein [Nanoarchaeota archaeon]MBU4086154.1 hypothetical protein [Nanoarchaeota archaeon]
MLKEEGGNFTKKKFIASAFKTFNLNISTLTDRIAFQKTIYLMQNLGSGTRFKFVWHNFGPFSSEVATIGQFLTENEIQRAELLTCQAAKDFSVLKRGKERDTKFLEMMSDIVFLGKNQGIHEESKLFGELIRHRSYLDDKELFNLSIQRLKSFNLI